MNLKTLSLSTLGSLTCLHLCSLTLGAAETRPADFAHQIAPILQKHCADCHTGAKKKGGLAMNTREELMAGSENGAVLVPGDPEKSLMVRLMLSHDEDEYMPPKGDRVSPADIATLKAWIAGGAIWEAEVTLGTSAYEPPLHPRRPTLPPAREGRMHPIDRLVDADLTARNMPLPGPIPDGQFLRRVSLDLVGLLPSPAELEAFETNTDPEKRSHKIQELLHHKVDYAEHWLTFWNDLLRNDYAGTGYIDGGRKQITGWLYEALLNNKPYDQFTRELIAPSPESEGFSKGIKWRGEVSAGQTVEIQFSQSISQTFLGINMKCASCHDSFVDRWKLDEAYGLAAVFAEREMEIFRCDKPTGRKAVAGWIFPELGQINPAAPKAQRLEELAGLMTHSENGRFSRTLVNRLWHRLMGRGIVHPVDAMGTRPWNEDLLDFLAADFQDHGYNIQHTLALITSSQAYQSQSEQVHEKTDDKGYHFAGPRSRRMTAEQFVDALWQLTGTAPDTPDAKVNRTEPGAAKKDPAPFKAQWVWGGGDAHDRSITLRRTWDLPSKPASARVTLTVDNEYKLFVNGKLIIEDTDWMTGESADLTPHLHAGANQIILIARNAGSGPNAAAVFAEFHAQHTEGSPSVLLSDTQWEWAEGIADAQGQFPNSEAVWQPVTVRTGGWMDRVEGSLRESIAKLEGRSNHPVRASLVKSDLLMRALGRPNREQIVSVRPNEMTTLEAIDLANGPSLYKILAQGSQQLGRRSWENPDAFTTWLYRSALSRDPTVAEKTIAQQILGQPITPEGMQDVLWMVAMLPEFQCVR